MLNKKRTAGRLVPVFATHSEHGGIELAASSTLAMAKTAAARGETVLMIDGVDGALMREAGIVHGVSLGDVLYKDADMRDAKYVTANEHLTLVCAGDARLEDITASLDILSLGYDWVFAAVSPACSAAHITLAKQAHKAFMGYSSKDNLFMRAYAMLESIRSEAPKFDPVMLAGGNQEKGRETYALFAGTVREFLGRAPALGRVIETGQDAASLADTLLTIAPNAAREISRAA